MSEFCPECWKKINNKENDKTKYILSRDLDLCEECGEWKHVIIMERESYYMHKFRFIIFPFEIIGRLLILPYLIYKRRKRKI